MNLYKMPKTPLVEQYMSIRLGADIAQISTGETLVVETQRRLHREESYSFIHAMWYLKLTDGRHIISMPPGAGQAARESLDRVERDGLPEPTLIDELRQHTDHYLYQADLPETTGAFSICIFACGAESLISHSAGDCRRLTDTSIPPTSGLYLPEHCFPDGLVYGVIDDDHVVSVVFAHRTALMEDKIIDVGIETADSYRKRGYAKTALSALTKHMIDNDGEGYYCCSPENTASVNTARSVGYMPYGCGIVLHAPCKEE